MPDNSRLKAYYTSEEERQAAIDRGETTQRLSMVSGDGNKHYAVMELMKDGGFRIEDNLTSTEHDNLPDAIRLAERRDHGPFAPDVEGYAAWRIS